MQETKEIHSSLIHSNRFQPRLSFDQAALEELAQSIRENGLIQPLTVRPMGDGYELIAGERRFRATQILGWDNIPCIIMRVDDRQLAEMALVENIQREDLSAIEEAKAYQAMLQERALTQEQIAKRMGKSQSSIANKIRLLSLPQEIQNAVSEHRLGERHARALLGLSEDQQAEVYQKIIGQELSVRQTEALVQQHKEPKRKVERRGITRHLRIAINSVMAAVKMVKDTGVNVETEEIDKEDMIEVIIRFKK